MVWTSLGTDLIAHSSRSFFRLAENIRSPITVKPATGRSRPLPFTRKDGDGWGVHELVPPPQVIPFLELHLQPLMRLVTGHRSPSPRSTVPTLSLVPPPLHNTDCPIEACPISRVASGSFTFIGLLLDSIAPRWRGGWHETRGFLSLVLILTAAGPQNFERRSQRVSQ